MRPDRPRRTRPACGLLLAVIACLAAAGCTGGADSPPASSSVSVSTTTPGTTSPTLTSSTSSRPPSASTSTGGTASDPNVPAAARQQTDAGAEAFSAFFFDQVNSAYSTNDSERLTGLFLSSCKTCKVYVTSIDEIKAAQQKLVGRFINVTSVTLIDKSSSAARTFVSEVDEARRLVDRNGNIVQTEPASSSASVVSMVWAHGWTIAEVQQAK